MFGVIRGLFKRKLSPVATSIPVSGAAIGLVATLPTGLKAPMTAARDSGSTAVNVTASGSMIALSLPAPLSPGQSVSLVVRATQSDGFGVFFPVTLTRV